MRSRGFRTVFNFLSIFFIVSTTHAILVNRTIDDTNGDSVTGQMPSYSPDTSAIWQGPSCSRTGCKIRPNSSLAFDNTWMAATYNPGLENINITLQFTGVAVWVFFILANNANYSGTTVTSNTQCNFTLDGLHAGSFSHQPDENTSDLLYNVSVFSTTTLTNASHVLVISTNDVPFNVYLNFDYAVYTVDSSDSAIFTTAQSASSSLSTASSAAVPARSSSNTVGIVVGCALGGLAFIVLLLVTPWFRRLRKARKNRALLGRPFHHGTLTSDVDIPWQITGSSSTHDRPLSTDLMSGVANLVPLRKPPHARSASSRDELRTVRQLEIDQRLESAQLEMSNLMSRQTLRRRPAPSAGDGTRQEETGQEMEVMRAQIRQLWARIESLQSERLSDWALGLSDDPPPAYVS